MNKKIIWISAIALSMSVSQATLACGCHHDMMSGEHYEKMIRKLDLTADQQSKIKAIKDKTREEMKPKFMEMRSIQMQLNTLAGAKDLDKEKVDKLITEKKDIMGSVMLMRVTTRHDIDMVLTAPQKAKLEAMKAKWEAKHMKKDCDKSKECDKD